MSLDLVLDCLWIGSDDLVELCAFAEQHDGRHGANGELLCNVREEVDVDLDEMSIWVLFGIPVRCVSEQLLKRVSADLLNHLGGDCLARATPGCVTVQNCQTVLIDSIMEVNVPVSCEHLFTSECISRNASVTTSMQRLR